MEAIWFWRVGILIFGTAMVFVCWVLFNKLNTQALVIEALVSNFTQLVSNITALIEERKRQGGVAYGQRADSEYRDTGYKEGG